MNIKELVAPHFEELVKLRRYFHEHPEQSGKELATIAYLEQYLKELNLVPTIVDDGGIFAVLDSGKPGKTLLLRADVDALPVPESSRNLKGAKACCSTVEGYSHACGHDCHMAMNMVAGKILAQHKELWQGKIILCFERGEEIAGNIKNLLPYLVEKSGQAIDGCYATHVRWDIPAGKVSLSPGAVMAGGFGFSLKLKGIFGHGARPDLANNPTDCFVAIYNDLNACRMRSVSPYECLTFSIGQLHGGKQINVIPGELTFGGTSRFFSLKNAGQHFMDTLQASVEHNCAIYNCSYEIEHMPDPLYEVYNNEACAALGRKAISASLGADALFEASSWMASETYSLYAQIFPGVLSFTGIANPVLGSGANHHTPEFDVDEKGLLAGATMAVSYAIAFLTQNITTNFVKNTEPIKKLAARNI